MRWNHPVAVHWRADAAALQGRLPPDVRLDRFEGEAWVSQVGIAVQGPAPGPLLRAGRFAYDQLNLRTYVRGPEGPGIFLLDTSVSRAWAALLGRIAGQPYRPVARRALAERLAAMRNAVITRSKLFTPEPDSLDAFLLERYWTYGGRPFGVRLAHAPWQVRAGLVEQPFRAPAEAAGDVIIAHLAESLDVEITGVAGRPRRPERPGQKEASRPRFSAPMD